MHRTKLLNAGLALTIVFSLSMFTGCNSESATQGSETANETSGDTLAITKVITDETTSTAAATHITSVTYTLNGEESTVTAEKGVLTLVVNGDQEDIQVGESFDSVDDFSFTDTTVENSGSGAPPWEPDAVKAEYNFRQALYVTGDGIVNDASVTDAISGEYTASEAKDVSVNSNGAFFNGIYIKDASYDITGLDMNFVGDGGDDFSGWGAGLMADGTAKVTVDDAVIDTTGVIRTAIWSGGESELSVSDSVIAANETQDTPEEYDSLVVSMMKRTPFALGMEGTVRATNVLNSSTAVYDNSIITSTGWGALSTDSGVSYEENDQKYALTVTNSLSGIGTVEEAQEGKEYTLTKEINGVTYGFTMAGSGYVTYADSGVWNKYDNVQFYSPDYVQIMASSNSSSYYTGSDLYSDRIAFMTQQNAGGTLSLTDSTIYAGDTLMQIKSGAANKGYTNFEIDNCEVTMGDQNPWSGTLLELVESDDAGNPGVTTYEINDVGDEATHASSKGDIDDSNATFKNGTYTGNIWNNIYNYTQTLNVTLDNATVKGAISSAYGYHADEDGKRIENGTTLTACTYPNYLDPTNGTNGDYLKIGAFVNVANEVVNNPINLTISNGSVWQVEGSENYLANVVIDSLDQIQAEEKTTVYAQSLTVGGQTYDEGTYENGSITYVVKAAEVIDTNTDTLATTQDYSGLHSLTFKAVDADGNPMSKGVAFDYKSFTNISFQVNAKDGYEIVSVECSDPAALTDNGDGSYVIDNLSNSDNTVTITLQEAASDMPGAGGPGGAPGGGQEGTPPGDMPEGEKPAA